ncbi:hypothetical protein SKTS_33110 [Sulfurimicrobium lacus]|uniref:Regulatory protein GemA n=1 Tax=Sulfurimicrobium lacus TaxID=2715678 RepID=A0A6F8VI31_9PROT|nr:phage protein GemA/Gp16 family protein [Sulfurimicrobium lacus]BCB28425.1 hypothetical protein SKTS_33110 [Sulfurimicrobium lacus]
MSDLTRHYLQLVGIAKGWATKNLPGWCDETHRDLLSRHGATMTDGRVSASTLNAQQLRAALDDYERRGWPRRNGFNPSPAGGRGAGVRENAKPVPPRIAHLVRLWGKLGEAGKVDKATRPALLAFCARQVDREVSDLDGLSIAECQAITEALKGWLRRA